ncbi:MAG: hypothetical protein JXR73_18005 [Candidatus Omnitrophica bacterium]|nr:hypothetical protein [Candidatus Omnitrophota bacterium]
MILSPEVLVAESGDVNKKAVSAFASTHGFEKHFLYPVSGPASQSSGNKYSNHYEAVKNRL